MACCGRSADAEEMLRTSMEDLTGQPDKQYARAVYDAINNGKLFPDGHEWAGFTQAEALANSQRRISPEQARAAKAAQAAPVTMEVKDTGKLAPAKGK